MGSLAILGPCESVGWVGGILKSCCSPMLKRRLKLKTESSDIAWFPFYPQEHKTHNNVSLVMEHLPSLGNAFSLIVVKCSMVSHQFPSRPTFLFSSAFLHWIFMIHSSPSDIFGRNEFLGEVMIYHIFCIILKYSMLPIGWSYNHSMIRIILMILWLCS